MPCLVWLVVFSLAACALGCGSSTSAPEPTSGSTAPVAATSEPPEIAATPGTAAIGGGPRVPGPIVAPLPTGHTAVPQTFVIVSRAMGPLEVTTTFGRLESLSVASLEEPLGMLRPDSPDEDDSPGHHPRACACPCGEPCPQCERPRDRSEPLPPGGRVELAWNGLLRRYRAGPDAPCFDTFAPPPGRYLVRACAGRPVEGQPGPCGRAEVTLPSAEPITIALGDTLETASCPMSPALLDRAARAALSMMERNQIVPDRVAACTPEASCYAETDLPYGEDVVRGLRYTRDPSAPREPPRACGILVAPQADRLLVRILLPLPEGMQGGERFDHHLDVEATRIYSMRYEQ